jgi:hypothetical protein
MFRPRQAVSFAAVLALTLVPVRPRWNTAQSQPLEGELSMVQMEQMRVIAPDSTHAAELSQREEKLKYELFVRERPTVECPLKPAVPATCVAAARLPLIRTFTRCAP